MRVNKILFGVLMVILFVITVLLFVSCEKSTGPTPAGSSQTNTVKIKLEVWYELNDSILFSPMHPCGDIVHGYVKQTIKWYESTCAKTNSVHTITVQQTGADIILADSMRLTIFIDGTQIQQAAGKKLLTTSYVY